MTEFQLKVEDAKQIRYNDYHICSTILKQDLCSKMRSKNGAGIKVESPSNGQKFFSLLLLILSDFAVVLISFSLAYFIRDEILPAIFPRFFAFPLLSFASFIKLFYFGWIWLFIFAYERLYTRRFPFWQEVKVLLKSTTLASLAIMVTIFIARKQIEFSRAIVVMAWMLSLVLFPLIRCTVKLLLVKLNLWKKKLIILGVLQTSLAVLKNIKSNRTMGYEVVGFLDDDPEKAGKSFLGVKVIGRIDELEKLSEAYGSKDIIVAIPHLSRTKLKKLLSRCEAVSDSMWLIPRSGDFITEGVDLEVLGDVLSLYIKKNLAKPWNIFLKTTFETILTVLVTILFIPVFLIIAMAIKLDSAGPVIFTQKRIGQNQRIFNLFKFRSMHMHNEEILYHYLKENTEVQKEWAQFKKLKNFDPRVTRVGKFIRRYSLDELPQLINILRGEMSLVGPRPYLVKELEDNDTFKERLALVRPGITGLWQISGRSEIPFKERISMDEYYIRNWSLWLDITILLKSMKIWLSKKGAY